MKISKWGIFCPGKSLPGLETYKKVLVDKPERCVAVNCAVVFPFPYDYWSMLDIEVFEEVRKRNPSAFRINRKIMSLWHLKSWEREIEENYPDLREDFRSYSRFSHSYCSKTPFPVPVYFTGNKCWWNYTLFCSIAMAIERGGKIIYIYGADMEGKGYGTAGYLNARVRHNKERWEEEREIYLSIKRSCSRQGIFIGRR